MADVMTIRRNVEKMMSMNAPKEDVDGYLATEGLTIDDIDDGAIPSPVSDITQRPDAGLNARGAIMGMTKGGQPIYDPIKLEAERQRIGTQEAAVKNIGKTTMSAEQELTATKRFIDQFGRSYNELKGAYPEIGKVGFSGWATRKRAWVSEKFDNLPETSAFVREKDVLANEMAREIEGGRVTDKDREVYARSMADVISAPSETNTRLAANKLLRIKDKGGNVADTVFSLYSSDVDVMRGIAKKVMNSDSGIKKSVMYKLYQQNPERFKVVK